MKLLNFYSAFVIYNYKTYTMKKTFVTRELGRSISEISKEEFISMVVEDVKNAKVEYRKWSDEEAEQRYERDCQTYVERRNKKIESIMAESKSRVYKRESFRTRWVEKEIAKLPETLNRGSHYSGKDLLYIKWDVKPWDNSSSYIGVNDESRLERLFSSYYDDSINNKYFKDSTGWSIVEDHYIEFKFHLSEELQAEWKKDEMGLANSISKFYSGSNYLGD